MKKILLLQITVSSLFWFSPQLQAGAWLQKKGHIYAKLFLSRFTATSFYQPDSDLEEFGNGGRFRGIGLFVYSEYGLSNELNLVFTTSYRDFNYKCNTCNLTQSGLGDLYLGTKYLLSDKNFNTSIQSGIKIPMGYETNVETLGLAPPLGDG